MGDIVSEHVEMYLVMIALLREDAQTPVPLSLLAQKLAISPVSTNEMCRKLAEQGLVRYQPYKGVTLTDPGETEAQVILSRRRLWVVFLVEELGIEPDEADEIACQLEHVTSERLVDALKAYLERAPAAARPRQQPVDHHVASSQPLSACAAGQQGFIAGIDADHATADFLHAQGLVDGAQVTVLVLSDDGTLLLGLGERRLSLAAPLAAQVMLAQPDEVVSLCTWEKCRMFWSHPEDAEACPRLADTGGSVMPCPMDCLART
jgi:DtxR family Mn-dependent transcriptional regulator